MVDLFASVYTHVNIFSRGLDGFMTHLIFKIHKICAVFEMMSSVAMSQGMDRARFCNTATIASFVENVLNGTMGDGLAILLSDE